MNDLTLPKRKLWLMIFILFVLGLTLTVFSEAPKPRIAWSQPTININLAPGESLARNLSFTSSESISNISIWAVPEIARFLNVQPIQFASVSANQPQPLRLSFSIPPGTALTTYEGTVHVRNGNQTLPQTLKIVLNIGVIFNDGSLGFSIRYPASWLIDKPESNVVVFSQPEQDPLQENGSISIVIRPNPEGKSLFEFYTAPAQRDILNQSDGVFSTGSVDGITYYEFNPSTTFSGERIIIIPRNNTFLEFSETGLEPHVIDEIFPLMFATLDFQ